MEKVCGIYEIRNKVNGKRYIGSSSNVLKRCKEHFRCLDKQNHPNIHLQRAYTKYGKDAFDFKLICTCTKELKLYLEQIYIDSVKPEYNISLSSSAPMQGRKHSEETKRKFKNRKVKRGKEHHSYGTKWTEEQKRNWIKIRTGEKRSDSFKQSQRERSIKNNNARYLKDYIEERKVSLTDCKGNVFDSLTECANYYKVSPSTICDVLKGRSKTLLDKYKVKYSDDSTTLEKIELKLCIRCNKELPLVNFPKIKHSRKNIDSETRFKYCNNCRTRRETPPNHWTLENCKLEALKYEFRSDFQKYSHGAYAAARIKGFLDECCSHMKPKPQILTEDSKANMKKLLSKRVKCSNGTVYNSVTEAAESTGISIATVSSICKGIIKKSRTGYSFSFYEEG